MRTVALLVFSLAVLAAGPARALPDLQVGLLFATEENDACMAQVHYIIQIANGGDQAIPFYDLYLVFDASEMPDLGKLDSYPGMWHKSDEPLPAGDLHPLELWWQNPPEGVAKGDYKSWLFLDPMNGVSESDETNNWEGPVFVSVTPPVCTPANLVVTTFEAVAEDGTIHYTCAVTNNGQSDVAEPFRLDLYHHLKKMPGYDTPGDQTVEIPSLKLGEVYEWKPTWTDVPDGMMRSWCVVDEDDRILESAESDNVADLKIGMCQACPPCPAGDAPVPEFCSCGEKLADTGFYCCDGDVKKKPCDWVPPEPVDANDGEDASSGEPVTIEVVEAWTELGPEPSADAGGTGDSGPTEGVLEVIGADGTGSGDGAGALDMLPAQETTLPPADEAGPTIDEGSRPSGSNGCSACPGSGTGSGTKTAVWLLLGLGLIARLLSGAIPAHQEKN